MRKEIIHESSADKQVLFTVRQVVTKHLGNPDKIEKVTGGNVHFVFKVTIGNNSFYAKLRSDRFAKYPDLTINPKDIRYEMKALSLLVETNSDLVPKIEIYSEEENLLILSDLNPNGLTLVQHFDQGNFDEAQISGYGSSLGLVHSKYYGKETIIREDGDLEAYERNLYYKFLYLELESLNRLIEDLKGMPKMLVLGDLSPKNICISVNGKVSFCDFESAHYGNQVYDLGCALAHIILHSSRTDKVRRLTDLFLNEYFKEQPTLDGEVYLSRVVAGILLYRLENNVIKYNHGYTPAEAARIAQSIKTILNFNNFSIYQLISLL